MEKHIDFRVVGMVVVLAATAVLLTACTQHQTKKTGSSSSASNAASVSSENTSEGSSAGSISSSVSSASSASASSPVSRTSTPSAAGSSSTSVEAGYTVYTNSRYGYSVPVLSTLTPVNAGSSSGQTFASADQAFMCSVSGSNNVEGLSASDYFQTFFYGRQSGILSKQESGNTTVVTWQVDGKFGYIKSVVGKGSVNTLRIQFPEGKKAQYDAAAQYMLAHFSTPDVDTAH